MKLPGKLIHNFIPRPIHDAYRDGILSGTLNAACLFMDISGFTKMTQMIQGSMESREQGAELMTLRTGAFFEPIVAAIYQRGGFITGYAGDGLTAVFPNEDAQAALAAAFAIRQAARAQRVQRTPFGTLDITLKQGLALGEVHWQILGPDKQKTYFYRGEAIDACAGAEHHAEPDEIVLHDSVVPYLPDTLDTEPVETSYHRLKKYKLRGLIDSLRPRLPRPISVEIGQHFFAAELLQRVIPGDFSKVTVVFFSFQGDPSIDVLDGYVSATIQAVRDNGGHFVEMDFGDKGGVMLAYFGTPYELEDSISPALTCVDQLRSLDTPLAWRAGISHGTAFSGLTGSPIRSKFTCTGAYVNLASRLSSKAEFGQTLVTDLVAEAPGFAFASLGPVNYKGFEDPIHTYALEGRR